MKKIVIFILLIAVQSIAWAGFPFENFNDASAWSGYTPAPWPYINTMTFNGNEWTFYRVSQYLSGSDYEMDIVGSQSGKITSHHFANGVGTLSFTAARVADVTTSIKIYYSIHDDIDDSFTSVLYNGSYSIPITSTSPTTFNIPINRSDAVYVRIQAYQSTARIDDISVSNELAPVVPTVTAANISDITKFTASGGGNVTADGGASVTARGVCWGISQDDMFLGDDNFTSDGSGTGAFTSQITGLAANTHYYVRAYATNSVGTGYSEFNFMPQFTTLNYVAPTAVTNNASDVNHVFAHLNGTVNGDEASTTVVFEYGLTDSYGSEVAAVESPFTSGDDESVHASLSELDEYTTYHYRVKATNVIGTTYGDDKTFTTTNNPNVVSTQSIPPATPDPDPIEFTGTGVTLDFSNVSGATGSNDITVSQYNVQPTNLTGIIGSEVRVSNRSYLITNHTGFTFSTRAEFLIDNIPGVNPSSFEDTPDGEVTDIKLWKRNEYGTGDFVNLGYLLYDDGSDDINVTDDDLLYLDGIDGFSEFTFSSDGDHSLSVILSTFTAQYIENTPTLYWSTQSETDNMGWFVYRNVENDFTTSEKISEFIEGHGTTTQQQSYIYEDNIENPEVGDTYYYWLESIDYSGMVNHYDKVAVLTIHDNDDPGNEPNAEPVLYGLFQNEPNPMITNTHIAFNLNDLSQVKLDIYNLKGQLVKSLYSGMTSSQSLAWDGSDAAGQKLSAGVYLYKLIVNGKTEDVKKLILMR